MRIRHLILSAILICQATIALGSPCPGSNVIADPPTFQWTFHPVTGNNPEPYYSGTLEYGEATFTIGGETLTTRAYRQAGGQYTIPGPTLVMTPGNKYVVRFHNTLPYEAPDPAHNVFKDPNITNLHTHGLHLSGESPGDDVTRFFEGGFGGDFVYDIQDDHMGGTFWYHAHHHGSTFLQVSSGAFGLIIIDDSGDGIPTNVAAMAERQLLVGFLDPDVAGTGGDTLISGTLSPTWTVNGTVGGNLCVPPDTWQHWRILVADRDARTKTISIGSQCEVALMARDGVWRTEVPLVLTDNSIHLTGASRADLAVRCSGDSDLTVDNEVVANVFVDGTPDSGPDPYDANGLAWSVPRPTYLRDLRGETPSNAETVNMGARTINGNKFDIDEPTFTLPAADLQEWTLKGARNHPFHLHVYHVQAAEDCAEYESGEYYDVVAQNCRIRFDLNKNTSTVYQGRTIMHCHILEHEDQGAMGWAKIGGPGDGIPAPTYPLDGDLGFLYEDYYSLGGEPVCNDGDGDGYGSPGSPACMFPEEDCDDADPAVNPGAAENCSNSIDDDCDGAVDAADPDCAVCTDNDGDGFGFPASQVCPFPNEDCDDTDPSVNPNATEICDNFIDDDCDGAIDATDSDCVACLPAGAQCVRNGDCCSENCSNGPPASRICIGN
ncbi:MAG: MopE-related protein [Acidobacteriota bacterium]|nr:MopE-related protein [Acidobacteriota bacterium]MDH3523682.1 MopE-related protein [Acidobacteriota bacterium]